MNTNLLKALRLTLLLVLLFGGLYTLTVLGMAQLVPGKGKGNKVESGGRKYYAGIGQSFTDDRYFQGRPSAVAYNAAGSGGSNKGPSNKEYLALIRARIDTFLKHNPGIDRSAVPVELVTASGSGLDPHISPKAALVQAPRIAALRHLSETAVTQLIGRCTLHPWWGPAVVPVLQLNLALDSISTQH